LIETSEFSVRVVNGVSYPIERTIFTAGPQGEKGCFDRFRYGGL